MEIIFFEGVDNSGKTTIAKELALLMGYEYFKNPNESKCFKEHSFINALHYEGNLILNLCKQLKTSKNLRGIIFDRYIGSEYTYSKTFNRKTNEQEIFYLDHEFARLNAKTIYCYKKYNNEFEDHLIKIKDISTLKLNYEKYFEKSVLKTLKINTTDENLSKQLITISNFIWGK